MDNKYVTTEEEIRALLQEGTENVSMLGGVISGLNMDNKVFVNCTFHDMEFTCCSMKDVTFINCSFYGCGFRMIDFCKTIFKECSINARFAMCNMVKMTVTDSRLKGGFFMNCLWNECSFSKCTFDGIWAFSPQELLISATEFTDCAYTMGGAREDELELAKNKFFDSFIFKKGPTPAKDL